MVLQKRKITKMLNETKKIHMKKKDLTRENLMSFQFFYNDISRWSSKAA